MSLVNPCNCTVYLSVSRPPLVMAAISMFGMMLCSLLIASAIAIDYDITSQPQLFLHVDSSSSIIDYTMTSNNIILATGTYLPESRHDSFTIFDFQHGKCSLEDRYIHSVTDSAFVLFVRSLVRPPLQTIWLLIPERRKLSLARWSTRNTVFLMAQTSIELLR